MGRNGSSFSTLYFFMMIFVFMAIPLDNFKTAQIFKSGILMQDAIDFLLILKWQSSIFNIIIFSNCQDMALLIILMDDKLHHNSHSIILRWHMFQFFLAIYWDLNSTILGSFSTTLISVELLLCFLILVLHLVVSSRDCHKIIWWHHTLESYYWFHFLKNHFTIILSNLTTQRW